MVIEIEVLLYIGLFLWFGYKYDSDTKFRNKIKGYINNIFGGRKCEKIIKRQSKNDK